MVARLRCGARVVGLLVLLLACVVPHLLARILFRKSRWPRRFLRWAGWLCGARVTVVGRPVDRDIFYVANHVSWLDILVLGGATGCAFVSRDDIGRAPVLGWMAAQNHTILVDRATRGAVRGQIGTLRAAMARRQPVTLFPEGTTGDGRQLLPFKPALFAVLLPPPRAIRIQPVLIDYGAATDDMAWIDDEPGAANALRVLGRRRTPVLLHFLEPFDPGEHPDRKGMAAEARGRIMAAMATRPG